MCFVPLLEQNPGDATAIFQISPVSPDPLNARSLRSLGFPKSPPLKILDLPVDTTELSWLSRLVLYKFIVYFFT